MRIIHTADWHLGQHFMGKSREPEHKAFLDWLLSHIKQQQVDALIVAGDVFDTGTPPSYARQLYYSFAVEILKAGCQMVVVGGNHDSVAMLEESRDLLDHVGIRQIARPTDNPADQVVKLFARDSREQPAALVCAIPFLRAQHIVKSAAGQDIAAKQQQLQTAIAEHYASVYRAAVTVRGNNDVDCPIIATGHLTAVGVSRSDSVRDIYIGTLEAFPADAFPPADYIALGYIHGAQIVAGSEKIRYSGSPIPLSFDETGRGNEKSVVQLTVGPGSQVDPEVIPVPQYRALHTIRGTLDSVEKQVAALGATITTEVACSEGAGFETASSETASSETDRDQSNTQWLEIIVETQDYLNDLQQRVANLLDGCDAEVVLLRRQRGQNTATPQAEQNATLNELSVDDIFDIRLQEAFAEPQESPDDDTSVKTTALKARLKTMYQQVVSDVRNEEPVEQSSEQSSDQRSESHGGEVV
jgi:exonuclease SbcD